MNTNTATERVNLVAAAIVGASGIHLLLGLFHLPGLLTSASPGVVGILIAALKSVWTTAGVLAAGFVVFNACWMFNGRDYQKSRIAAIGALVLPLVGMNGFVSAFALLPVGLLGLWFLNQPVCKAVFGIIPAEAHDSLPMEAGADTLADPSTLIDEETYASLETPQPPAEYATHGEAVTHTAE